MHFQIYRIIKITLIIALFGVVSSCTGIKNDRNQPSLSITDLNATPPGLCLSLSGGGIRSGAVSLGVLQELHRTDQLKNFHYISSVSGGGYPIYGILFNLLRKKTSLTKILEETGAFIQYADEHSDFITAVNIYSAFALAPIFWAPLTWVSGGWYGAARPTYAAEIHRTFAGGGNIPLLFEPRLSDVDSIVGKNFPIPIFGGSASMGKGIPENGYNYSSNEFFEMSPNGSGSPKYGYFRGFSEHIELGSVIAISAAAIDTPNGEFQLPDIAKALNIGLGGSFRLKNKNKGITSRDTIDIYIADGGFIENLGILPLLRRGCSTIVSFDNSDDPNAQFKSWRNFTKRAFEEGWNITRKLEGTSHKTDKFESGWFLRDHSFKAEFSKNNRKVKLHLIKLGINQNMLAHYPSVVRDFAKTNWNSKQPGCNGKSGMEKSCSFPLQSTNQQSFSNIEFKAYRYMGKCLAKKSKNNQADCSSL